MLEAEPDALVAAVLHQQPLQKLLRAGADPTVRDQTGLTPLHHAVLAGNADAVVALLSHACKRTRPLRTVGGEPSRAPGSPWDLVTAPGPPPSRPSPIHLAAERSDSLLRLILGHGSLTSVAASFLGIPISSRPQTELLHLRDARGWSLLHYAVSRANLATMRQLLPHMGANAADMGSSGSSRSGSTGGASPCITPHQQHNQHFTYGINVPDGLGRTALHQAALLGHADCCRLLLKAGADQSLASGQPEGALPLHLAASGNHTAVIEVLFRHAVNEHGFRAAQTVLLRPNAAGLTALHVAVRHGAVDAAKRLLHLVFPFDTRGPLGRTALHIAALLGDTSMISMLLGHSTPQQHHLRDAEGFAAMHLSATAGRLEAMRVLAAGGCGVDVRAEAAPHAPSGCEGWTPLHCAVRQGDVAAIELLISELGADPHAKDAGGRTPYDLAVAVAGDDSRPGSSVVGAGSGIHNLDDAQWGTDATCTESEEGGGRSGSSPNSATARGDNSTTLVPMVVDPLQGPSGVNAGPQGCNGPPGGGSTRLDETQALAVLQTFIRLLHEPARNNALPSSLVSVLGGGTSTHSASSSMPLQAAAGQLMSNPSCILLTSGACDSGGMVSSPPPTKRTTAAGLEAAPPVDSSEIQRAVPPGVSVNLELPSSGIPVPGSRRASLESKSAGAVPAQLPCAGSSGDNKPWAIIANLAAPGVPEATGAAPNVAACKVPETGQAVSTPSRLSTPQGGDETGRMLPQANGKVMSGDGPVLVTIVPKLNGHVHGGERDGLRPVEPQKAPGGGADVEVPSVALTYTVHMLAGPAATPTRSSPFSKPAGNRQSPFRRDLTLGSGANRGTPTSAIATTTTATAALSGASAAIGMAPAADGKGHIRVAAFAEADANASDATANPATTTAAAIAQAATANSAAKDSCSVILTGVDTVSAAIVPGTAAVTTTIAVEPTPAVPPVATKRSPFFASAKQSPFALAAAARHPTPATPLPQQLLQSQQQLLEKQPLAVADPAAFISTAAETTTAKREAPMAVTAPAIGIEMSPGPLAAAEVPKAAVVSGDRPAGSMPLIEAIPATAEQPQWSMTPFSTAAAQHQGAPLSNGLPPGAAIDPITSLCVVSAINSPCGYSALNRAILLQRHALAEALLATLPPQGHRGGVLLLGGLPPGGGRASAATVAYQAFDGTHTGMAAVALLSLQGRNLSPSQSHQQMPLAPEAPSEALDNGGGPRPVPLKVTITRPASTNNPTSALAAAPGASLNAAARFHTPTRQHATHMQLQLHQLTSGVGSSPAASDRPGDASSRVAPPLLPLRCPFGIPPLTAGASMGTALIPGLVHWDEVNEVFRTQPANHTSRAWLHWPGTPDPSTGWFVAEMVVVEAGTGGGHVWLGLGPPPDVLAAVTSSSNSSSSAAPGSGATTGPAVAASGLSTKPSGLPASAMSRSTTAPTGALMPGGAQSGRGGGGGGAAGVAGAAVPTPVAMCPVINHRSTHVACLRDGQAFRGGVLAADLGAATRLEARTGDTVALFWNRRGRSAAYTLNGRYCGRLSGLPANVHLTPLVGLQCAGFAFKWRCCSRLGSRGISGPPEPYTCASCTSNIDGMLIREQMLHEDPETPWLCKPSMSSLHFAAWSGNVRVLPQLVRAKGFSPDEPDVDGWTPLHFAALAGQDEAVRLLLSLDCEADRMSKYGSTPAMLAAKYGRSPEHVAIVRILSDVGAVLDLRDPRGRTLLMLAARAGNLAMVQLLLERGLDPSATDALEREAQQYAGQHAAIFRLLRSAQAAQRAGARKRKRRQHGQPPAPSQSSGTAGMTATATAAMDSGVGVAVVALKEGEEDGKQEEEEGEDGDEEEDEEGSSVEVSDGNGTDADVVSAGRGRDMDVQHLPLLSERWRVGAGQLVRGRLIEQGAFGAVFEGTWCGARVAIKQVMRRRHSPHIIAAAGPGAAGDGDNSEEEDPAAAREALSLEREVAILAALPPHERIARMLGSVKLPGEGTCLVMAYYPHTLQSVMQSERLRRSWLTPSRRTVIARQLAEGMAFLHGLPGPRVIHRDLKPNNVLLEAAPSLGVKICDFGLSRLLAGSDVQSSSAAGHAFWMAPELLRAQSYDEKVDVYSYGVILYQLAYWVDDQLYGGLNKAQVDFQVVHGILRLQDRLPGGIDLSVQALVRDCVDENPRNRPPMVQVLERLSSVRELPQPGHVSIASHPGGAIAAIGPGEVPTRPVVTGTAVLVGDPEHHRQG